MTGSAHSGVDVVAAGARLERGYCFGEKNWSVVVFGGQLTEPVRAPASRAPSRS
jgi:hypothetical protein